MGSVAPTATTCSSSRSRRKRSRWRARTNKPSRRIRINKFLAAGGVASRRSADEVVARGVVRVDGSIARAGQLVDPTNSVVTVRGKRVSAGGQKTTATDRGGDRVVVLNKPAGVVTTMRDEHGRTTVAHLLPGKPRLFPIGRLDVETTGVLLCTNDGELANLLTHPSARVERTYLVRVAGSLSAEQAELLSARDIKRDRDGHCSFELTLTEGKNRQVRRTCARLGLRVVGLTRTRFGPVSLRQLAPGATRSLTHAERDALERLRSRA